MSSFRICSWKNLEHKSCYDADLYAYLLLQCHFSTMHMELDEVHRILFYANLICGFLIRIHSPQNGLF